VSPGMQVGPPPVPENVPVEDMLPVLMPAPVPVPLEEEPETAWSSVQLAKPSAAAPMLDQRRSVRGWMGLDRRMGSSIVCSAQCPG
jgi:hypothetical protein